MQYNKLVRDKVVDNLKTQGYQKISGTKVKGKQYKEKLYSLFFAEYKETLATENINQLHIHYADMLEVVKTLMLATKTKINDIDFDKNRTFEWFKKSSPSKQKLGEARINLLQRFEELLGMKTEAIRDQLADLLTSLKDVINANNLSFVKVESVRRVMYDKLGGFKKGIYLESVSKTKTASSAYAI